MFSVFLSSYRNSLVKVWENSKKLWKHSPAACVPTAFLVLPNVHACFYNSIETWYMFSISYINHYFHDRSNWDIIFTATFQDEVSAKVESFINHKYTEISKV